MKKLHVLLYVFMILSLNLVFAVEYDYYYPDYMDVNVSENITIYSDEMTTGQSAWLYVSGSLTNMTKKDNFTWYSTLISSEAGDVPFIINIIDGEVEQHNASDGSQDATLLIINSSKYGFINYSNKNATAGNLEHNIVCANIRKFKGSPIIKGFISNSNGTQLDFNINYGDSLAVTNAVYETICTPVDYAYSYDHVNLTEIFGIQCTNCDSNNQIQMALDTTSINGLSVILTNSSNFTTTTTSNYILSSAELEGNVEHILNSIFYFRNPYYITFRFYEGINTTTSTPGLYESLFDYVYLYEDTSTGIKSPAYLGGIIEAFALIPGTGDFYDDDRYTYDYKIDTFYWDQYENGVAIIKLYELTSYQVNILGSDVMSSNPNFNEFDKPRPGNKRWQTQIVNIDFDDYFNGVSRNATFSVYLQPWEANKSKFMLDIVKWMLIFGLLIALIVVEVMMRVPGVVIIYSVFGYAVLMGGIGWLV